MKKYLTISLLSVFFLPTLAPSQEPSTQKRTSGSIQGQISDAATGEPLSGATVSMVNKFGGALADEEGYYLIKKLSPGAYRLRVSHVGYESQELENISVESGVVVDLNVALRPTLTTLKGVTVTPGRFTIMGTEPATTQNLTRQEIETLPQLGDDFFRAVSRLPGVSANDFSTRFTVRGGEYEEVLVTLDGLQLYEPFHLKDIDGGVMSAVDVAAVEGIDLMTGGFPANYGDKSSGVFNITSKRVPPDTRRLSLGLSFLNARIASEGTFANNKGSWLLSARRGYIDLVLKMTDANDAIKPTYYDLFAKTRYQLSRNHILSVSFLHAGDDLNYYGEDSDAGDTLETNYSNSYAWLTLHSALGSKLTAKTIWSVGKVTHDRSGSSLISSTQQLDLVASDQKEFRYVGLKSDWELEISKNHLFMAGVDARSLEAEYDYLSWVFDYRYETVADTLSVLLDKIDTTQTRTDRSGRKIGAYLSDRFRLSKTLTAEFGLRYDYSGYSADEYLSPRLNLMYNVAPSTTFRTAWGYYYQSQEIDDLLVGDRQPEFYQAVRAEHRVVGFEHSFPSGVQFRLEGYYKRYTDPWPDYRNSFDPIAAFPELESDRSIVNRHHTTSEGIEIYLKKDNGGKVSWWASYALAKVEDSVTTISFPSEKVEVTYNKMLPSPYDQRHTLYLDLKYRPSHNWQLNFAAQFHTGWPFTDVFLRTTRTGPDTYVTYVQAGEQWGARHEHFSRLDVRVNRYFGNSKRRINIYVEILNVLNRKNIRGYNNDLAGGDGSYYLVREAEHWFGTLPSIGIAYDRTF